jgi:GDP-L-fucose synthase
MKKNSRIYVAGHRGLVGSSISRALRQQGYTNLIERTHDELDLRDPQATCAFFDSVRPEYVFVAAAKVGGILANHQYPAAFIFDNLLIETSVIHAAWLSGVDRLLFLGSSCIYPKMCPQPIKEQYLLTGALEPTNRAYAVAKIAGIEMCWGYNRQYGTRYLCAMPSNLYGPGDNFDVETSHVVPAIIRKATDAKARGDGHLTVWGTGTPRRELLYSDDLAEACLLLMNLDDRSFQLLLDQDDLPPVINIGYGDDRSIREIAETVCRIVGFNDTLVFDNSRPDGTPRKLLDSSRMRELGWRPKVDLADGIRRTIAAMPRYDYALQGS